MGGECLGSKMGGGKVYLHTAIDCGDPDSDCSQAQSEGHVTLNHIAARQAQSKRSHQGLECHVGLELHVTF